MPGITGLFELLPKAKAVRPDVPIIMITAYGDAETKRNALEAGAEALFTKPIDFGMLRSEIDTRVDPPMRRRDFIYSSRRCAHQDHTRIQAATNRIYQGQDLDLSR